MTSTKDEQRVKLEEDDKKLKERLKARREKRAQLELHRLSKKPGVCPMCNARLSPDVVLPFERASAVVAEATAKEEREFAVEHEDGSIAILSALNIADAIAKAYELTGTPIVAVKKAPEQQEPQE